MTPMSQFRRLAVLYAILQLTVVVPVSATQDSQSVMEPWQLSELQTLVDVVSAAVRGKGEFAEEPFRMTTDFLKGMEGKTYVPFTLAIDPSRLTESSVAMYLYVTPQAEASPAPSPDGTVELPEPAFEDGHFIDVAVGEEGEPIEVTRAFAVTGGIYDVYVAVRDSLGADADDEARLASTVMILKEEVKIPDFWNDELQASSLIVAELVEPIDQPLSEAQRVASPYTIGTTRIVPRMNREFSTADEILTVLVPYNPRLTLAGQPDLTVDFSFYSKSDNGEEFFNRTSPQQFNALTLPPAFDLASGHQFVAGQAVSLSLFPVGSYRLEITVTDNVSGLNVVREVSFVVNE